jgi:hypothetical protein
VRPSNFDFSFFPQPHFLCFMQQIDPNVFDFHPQDRSMKCYDVLSHIFALRRVSVMVMQCFAGL